MHGCPVLAHIGTVPSETFTDFLNAFDTSPSMVSCEYTLFSTNASTNPFKIGLYPVHLHKFPDNASSMSCGDINAFSAVSLLRAFNNNAYMDMTNPGVQNPHCDPCAFAMAICTGCKPSLAFPSPSIVITWCPSNAYIGAKHALTALCAYENWSVFVSYPVIEDATTVHAPHPPSPHPSFVPVKRKSRKNSNKVVSPMPSLNSYRFPFTYIAGLFSSREDIPLRACACVYIYIPRLMLRRVRNNTNSSNTS